MGRRIKRAHATLLAADGVYARMWRLQQDQMQVEAAAAAV